VTNAVGLAVRRFGSAVAWLWNHSLGWILKWTLIGLVSGYRLAISPMLPPTCRFHPSCSAYALGAIKVHGPLKGSALAGWRLLRCNPWSGGGVDPVPDRGRWLPDVLPNGEPRSATMGSSPASGGVDVTS
jgi:uncharacterized protein